MDLGRELTSAGLRIAGDVALPGELNALRNLLLRGTLEDETGSVSITPQGLFEVRPANSPISVRGSAGYDPSIYVGYQSKRPAFEGRSPEAALDEALLDLGQRY